MKQLVLLMLMTIHLSISFAREHLIISQSEETNILMTKISELLPVMSPCLAGQAMQLEKAGKTHREAMVLLSDSRQNEQYRIKCACENRFEIQNKIDEIEKILAKHPEWSGKDLAVDTGAKFNQSPGRLVRLDAVASMKLLAARCSPAAK